ncbi:MAG: M42 family peptidase, partial [Oscillospiraceae bacterium]|nr:M42 family peptidase [Oscillospiraceae bacterium]
LGSGAIISRGPNMNRAFTDKIIEIAKAGDIPHTISVEPGDSGTDARVIQTARAGVATALLGIPLRNMHSAVETVSIEDAESLARLICATLKGCDFGA